jgi:glycosyltransferase involved in cell wall biosynthesis
MRVGLLTSWMSHSGGGVFDVVRRLAPALQVGSEFRVAVFGLAKDRASAGLSDWDGIPVAAQAVYGSRAWGYAPGLKMALRQSRLDLLHVHGLWMYPSVASCGWAHSTGKPYIIAPHGMLDRWAVQHHGWKKRLALWTYEARHLRGAACLHALCEAEARSFRELGLTNPICVVPNSVTEDATATDCRGSEWQCRGKTLLYLGRLHPKKGLINLLYAWQRFSQRAQEGREGWHLVIAGWDQDGHEHTLRRLASDAAMDGSVHFLGPRFGADKDALFRSATAFVLPSVSEGLPMVVLEAWSYGLPVLMTLHCNLPIGFERGAALQIDTDVDGLKSGLETMGGMSGEELKGMGERGRRLCEERFAQRETSNMIKDVYRWLLKRGPKPACIMTD